MYSSPIFLLAFGLLISAAMARPGKRPSPGHHHGNTDNEGSQGQHGHKLSTFRLPSTIRLPSLLAGKLGQPSATYTVKKVLDGKYLLISPALLFKLKDGDSEESTTAIPEGSTTEPTVVEETTTVATDEETTAPVDEEDSTTIESEVEETSSAAPSFFGKRSFPIDNDEQLLFLED